MKESFGWFVQLILLILIIWILSNLQIIDIWLKGLFT